MDNQQATAIGFLGGTFDPIHYGHLRPALEIQQALNLRALYLMPNYIAPHKAPSKATTEQRIEMVKLAIQDQPAFKLDSRELLREKPSYTIDTLKLLRRQYPDTPLCFIMGMDSLLSFDTWYQYQQILDYCHIIISQRPGWHPHFNDTIAAIIEAHQVTEVSALHNTTAGYIYFQDTVQLDISSSGIRDRLSNQQSIEGLTPDAVCHYIKEQHCY